jgi:hypothetical protein
MMLVESTAGYTHIWATGIDQFILLLENVPFPIAMITQVVKLSYNKDYLE